MPQIIVVADPRSDRVQLRDGPVMFTERVTVEDFESQHFQIQLVERLGWAVGDAAAVERAPSTESYSDDDVGNWDDEPQESAREVSTPAREPAASREPPGAAQRRSASVVTIAS